ncbi:MAG: methenyltetrahydromethanopterin cyclohydrolase [Pirellulales bacterium]
MSLNDSAFLIIESLLTRPECYSVSVNTVGGTRVIDCGVLSDGSMDAGLLMARAAMAGLGDVRISPYQNSTLTSPPNGWKFIAVESSSPIIACLATQYAGWKIDHDGYFAMASGPMRAAIGKEDIFTLIGQREKAQLAIGILEANTLPTEKVCQRLAHDAHVSPDNLVLLVAKTASQAGMLQVIARSLETAIHKLHDLSFDLHRIVAGSGTAPLAPIPQKNITAIGRSNDAILYGGHVVLSVTGDDASLIDIGPRTVSRASPDYGMLFCEIFRNAGGDFYNIDPSLFAPAVIDFVNVETGSTYRFGELAPSIVEKSFSTID